MLDIIAGHPQGAMGGQVDHPQVLGQQHGAHCFGAGQLLEQLHVADGLVSGQAGRFLVQWRRGQSIDRTGQGQFAGLGDPLHGGFAAGNADLADGDILGVEVVMSTTSTTLGSAPAADGSSVSLISSGRPVSLTACSIAKVLPTTRGRQEAYTWGSARALTTTSGPMPQGSPMVMAIAGFELSGMTLASRIAVGL